MSQHPSRIGPYRISRILGRGGTGVVYAAVHDDTGQRVALKVIRADRARHRLIKREVAALSRLRHPQIVAVLDHGEADGAPWFAMELVEGEHLSELADRRFGSRDRSSSVSMVTFLPGDELADEAWPAAPNELVEVAGGRLSEALDLVRALCEPLAFLHGEGLVHRDLKPENVLIRADGTPVLVDFGLASGFAARGRETLDLTATRAGTPPYMAPEQVRGASVDARADLYALGCILYELLTGRPPFVGLRAAVLRAHLHEDPRPPSTYVGGVPPALDALCLALLAKRPADRIGYATEVARQLEALGATPADAVGPTPRRYLYRPQLVARRDALARVEEGLGAGGLILVAGGEGVGKTRFVDAVARRWSRRGGQVVAAAARARGDEAALAVWRPVLQALAHADLAPALGAHRGVLARFEPALGAASDEVLAPEAERLRVVRAMTAALELLADQGHVLVLLDDLHGADALSLDALVWAMRIGLKLPVVGTVRPSWMPAELSGVLDDATVVELGALTDAEVRLVAADMLAVSHPPEPLVDWLIALTHGNSFAVAEALRLAVAEGAVVRDQVDAAALAALPTTVEGLVARRLDAVPAGARHVLEAAAVLGPDLGATALGAMLGLDADEAVAEAGPLLAADILELHDSGAVGWVHDPLWVAARARLDPDRRKALHRAAAAALEAYQDNSWLAAIAWHLNTGGLPEEAATYYARAGALALGQGALAEAERRYREAAGLVAAGPESRRIRLQLAGKVLAARGDNEEARQLLEQVCEEARAEGDLLAEGEAWNALAVIYSHASDTDQQLAAARSAVSCWERAGDRHKAAKARRALGIALGDIGDRDGSKQALLEALETLRELGDKRSTAEVLANLGIHALGDGELEVSRRLYGEARVLADETGDRLILGLLLTNLATVAWREGDLEQAVELLGQAIGVHRAIGARRAEGITLSNTAVALSQLGDQVRARELFLEALAIDREVLNLRSEAWDLCELGEVEVALGEMDAARTHFAEAVAVARKVAEPYVLSHVLLGAVRFERWLHGGAAEEDLAELERMAEAAGRHTMTARVMAERGHHLLAAGRDASEVLDRVRAHVARRPEDHQAALVLAALDDAVSGDHVVHGEAVAHLPAPVRDHLGLVDPMATYDG